MRIALCVSVSLATLMAANAAMAQQQPPPTAAVPKDDTVLADIIVTAQKRSERVQDVPISISAFGGDTLAQANVTQVSDLTRLVPTFNFGTGPGSVGARLGVRGLGAFGNSAIEPSVATFLDGVYVPRAGSLNAGLLDVAGLEVLSGPQGTLYGRNASVGAINITTKTPTHEFEGSVAAEAGTGHRYRGEIVLNAPISDRFAVRFAGLGENFDGYWRYQPTGKRFGGVDTASARVTAKADFTDDISWIVRADYQHQSGSGYQNVSIDPNSVTPALLASFSKVLGGRLPVIGNDSNWSANDPSTANVNDYHWGVSSTLNVDTNLGLSFKLIDSYRHWRALESDGEVTFTPVPLVYRTYTYESESQNHELQVISPKDWLLDGKLSFVGGAYYFREKLHINYDYNLRAEWCSTAVAAFAPPLVAACNAGPKQAGFYNRFPQTTESYAGYGQATYKITPTLDLTLGGRWTHEEKDATYVGVRANASAVFGTNETSSLTYSDGRFTDRANLTWRPASDVMVFATYSTGFKAGGFNAGASNAVLGTLRNFGPERVTNYELGAKTQLLDRRVTLDATVFRMDVQGFQERALINAASVVRNVGDIRSQGVEADVVAAPTSWMKLNASVAYLDATFTSYPNAPGLPWLGGVQDLTGKRPTFAPKFTTSLGAELHGKFGNGYKAVLRTDLNTVSSQNLNSANDASPLAIQKAYALLSARLTMTSPDDRYSVALFGQNLTDRNYCVNYGYQVLGAQLGAQDAGKSTAIDCFHGNPRTFGVRVGAQF